MYLQQQQQRATLQRNGMASSLLVHGLPAAHALPTLCCLQHQSPPLSRTGNSQQDHGEENPQEQLASASPPPQRHPAAQQQVTTGAAA